MNIKITFFLLIISTSLLAQNATITAEKKARIAEYIEHFKFNNQLLGNVAIKENGNDIINTRFGTMGSKDASSYTIGSVTKMFTAVLFAKMMEKDIINWDEKLNVYFPQIPNSEIITLKHMLNHTSGLQDYVVKEDSLYFWLKEPVTQMEIFSEIIRQGSAFKPGDSLSYSNSAYYLLARILEQKTNKTYQQLVVENITQPLEMINTFAIDEKSLQLRNVANSYEKRNDAWTETDEFYFPNVSGVGNIASTAADLNRMMSALFSGKIIDTATLNKMLPIEADWFGVGFMKVPFYEYIAYGHGGDTYGTHSVTSFNANNGLAISYIINGEHYPTNDFAIGLLSIVYGKEYTLPEFKEYKPELRFYEQYGGTYGASGFPLNIKIFKADNQLMAQAEGQPEFTLTPTAKHIFSFAAAGLEIEFMPFENKLILKQGGQLFELLKK